MAAPTPDLETLTQCFLQTLSPLPAPRRQAESTLSTLSLTPSFPLAVLRLASTQTVPDPVRVAAAVHFKNLLRSHYPSLPPPDQSQIKSLLLPFLLSSPPLIRSQLSESLTLISSHDFPSNWPSLLPDLVTALKSAPDYSATNALLSAVNSVFKKFRSAFNSNETRLDLKYCLDHFCHPLLDMFLNTSKVIANAVASGTASAEVLRPMFESQRLCCRIFYSLNSIELPEFFEDHMKEWMGEFRICLVTVYPTPVEADGTVDAVRSAVCENLQLYMEKNEEEFKDYLGDFASAVWNLLMTPSSSVSRDRLTITAIRFLTTISTSVHHGLFGSPDVLKRICESIVFPNVRVRDEDEELFEMNYVEYIRRDIEGSDMDTRRRIACELLKGIAVHYREQVMAIVAGQVQTMLAAYVANPVENWKEKDCAIYVVVSLATKKAGGTMEAAYLIDVESFFSTAIVPELQSQDVNGAPMLKAGALKFFSAFRAQLPKQTAVALLPDVTRFLASESNVVHSYAANCIEKLLLLKDGGVPRFSSVDISPFMQLLITNLFKALQFPESQENPYVMKCVMRVLGVADIAGELAAACIGHLSAVLGEVCKNPKDPVFNHYLFEAIAASIGRSCEKNPSLISVYETSLFPVLQNILMNDITEFWPYVFQIFAQLVNINSPPLSQNYMQLFELLLTPESWKRPANVPALARLLQAYLKKVPHELNSQGRLSQVLGIFQKLISASSTEELGFYVLNTVIENLGYDVIAPYIQHIWSALFTRLQNQRTVRFIKSLIIFMSLVLVKHGPAVLVDSMNAVQPNLFRAILEQFWIPNLKLITGFIEMKLTAVASTRLICESPALLDDSAVELWVKMLDSIVTLVAKSEQDRVEEEKDVPDIGETTGYTASFVRLHNAGRKEEDPLKEIKDPKEFVVTSLARLSASAPGKYLAVMEKYLDPSSKEALHDLCKMYNCAIA